MADIGATHKAYSVIAGMATMPKRMAACAAALISLKDQVDLIVVYANRCPSDFAQRLRAAIKPAWVQGGANVHIVRSEDALGDLGDAGKFYPVFRNGPFSVSETAAHTHFFSVDDDLVYAPDAIRICVSWLDAFDDDTLVTVHGKRIRNKITSYYRDRANMLWYHWRVPQSSPAIVHIPGTGLCGARIPWWRSFSTTSVSGVRNAGDLHVARYALMTGRRILRIPHDGKIMTLSPHVNHAVDTIWAWAKDRDKPQTDYVNDKIIPLVREKERVV